MSSDLVSRWLLPSFTEFSPCVSPYSAALSLCQLPSLPGFFFNRVFLEYPSAISLELLRVLLGHSVVLLLLLLLLFFFIGSFFFGWSGLDGTKFERILNKFYRVFYCVRNGLVPLWRVPSAVSLSPNSVSIDVAGALFLLLLLLLLLLFWSLVSGNSSSKFLSSIFFGIRWISRDAGGHFSSGLNEPRPPVKKKKIFKMR